MHLVRLCTHTNPTCLVRSCAPGEVVHTHKPFMSGEIVHLVRLCTHTNPSCLVRSCALGEVVHTHIRVLFRNLIKGEQKNKMKV